MPRVNNHPFITEKPTAFPDVYGDSIAGVTFETSEMLLAAYLLHLGHEPDAVVWNVDDGQPHCHWTFESQDTTSDDVRAFLTGDARVEPREFHHCVNTVRAAMIDADPR